MLRRIVPIAAAALALSACGAADEAPERTEERPRPAATPAGGAGGAPTFPERPQAELGARSLRADEREPAPRAVEPGSRPVTVVGTVADPTRLRGRAGVFCRGGDDGPSGYELTIDRRGRTELERVEAGERTLVAGYDDRVDAAADPSQPIPVILSCGRGDENGVTLGVAVGAQQLTYVRDKTPAPAGDRTQAGLVARGAPARFGALQLYLAD